MLSTITFSNAAQVYVEVVRTRAEIERGLSGYQSLGWDYGMMFDMGVSAIHPFWMHNVLFPLDIIFVNDAWAVVGIIKNAAANTDDLRSVGKSSRYVLEVNAGWVDTNRINVGDRMTLH